MIKLLLLYYLSIKPTHGYEMQRFIQINELDQWTKIQSGSIYYALAKLEADGLIQQTGETPSSNKARKEYRITEQGRAELSVLAKQYMATPICEAGSDKFFMYPLLAGFNREETVLALHNHIAALKEKQHYVQYWSMEKICPESLMTERLAFEMMLSSYDYQIRWHETMLAELDQIMAQRDQLDAMIRAFSFEMESQPERNYI